MTQSQLRQLYQSINTVYNKMAEVREESVPGLKEAKQIAMQTLVQIRDQLNEE